MMKVDFGIDYFLTTKKLCSCFFIHTQILRKFSYPFLKKDKSRSYSNLVFVKVF